MVGSQTAVVPGEVKAFMGTKSVEGERRLQLEQRPIARPGMTATSAVVPGGFERSTMKQPLENTKEFKELEGQPWQPLSDVAGPHERAVYFATNRQPTDPAKQSGKSPDVPTFGSDLADRVLLGKCTVNFPIRHHHKGDLATPGWWDHADPEQFFLINALELLAADQLTQQFGDHDVLLFIHGFDNSFADAVLRAGQLQYDTDFPGSAIAFCWPSDGSASTESYKHDVEKAEKSVRPLADVLELLTKSAAAANATKPAKVHVIAHSLGNRLFLAALHDLNRRGVWTSDRRYLGQVVLAAPDVGAARFNNLVGYAAQAAERLTYYYCRADKALIISQSINSYEPVGLYPYFETGLDTINADGVGTDFISHSYYGSSPKVLADLNLLFCLDYGPEQRMPPLSTHSKVYGHDHWSFLPVVVKEQ